MNTSFLGRHSTQTYAVAIDPAGKFGTPTMFDAEKGHTARKAKALRLKSIKRLSDDVLWIRYLVKNL